MRLDHTSLREQLVHPRENIYFALVLLFGILTYIFFVFSIIGIFIIGALILVSFFLHGLMVAGIRRNGVKLGERQFPELYAKATQVSQDMGLTSVPDIYVVESEGILNAFATRFFRKNMVVLYSEIFELIERNAEKEVLFVLAHEFAHLKRKHVLISFLLLPAMWVPFIGNAYLRACEYTCDRYAAYYVQSLEASKNALTILAIGKEMYHKVDHEVYMEQIESEFGFFAWLNERLSTHPHLPKRLYALSQFFTEEPVTNLKEPTKKILPGLSIVFLLSILLVVGGWLGFKALDKLDLLSNLEDEFAPASPLMKAASENDTEQIEILIADGANINEQDDEGSTALDWAIFNGHYEAFALLLEKGADPNTVDTYGTTPLMNAVFNENVQMVEVLLEHGANPTIKDTEGYTAHDYAKDYDNTEIMKLLQNK
ncbi:M48 family metallopeptidase [Neobacillus sp. D3-1R]|uniref:M48 family metallopeptidase n=1 Tax=Neobacillus sp. D3-1R TaxID=3445778 RepID=UPI003FA0EBC1